MSARFQSVYFLAFLAMPFFAAGQPERYEEKANEILSEASEAIKAHDAMKMTFIYTMISEQHGEQEQQKGYILTSGDKYYLNLGNHHFISDGETVWSFFEDVKEVHISLAEYTDDAISPASILENFKDDYTSKWIRLEPYGDKMKHIVDMVPRQPQAFFKFRLAILEETKEVVYTEAYDRQGVIYRYDIETIDTSPDIAENTFVFEADDYPEELEIIDLR